MNISQNQALCQNFLLHVPSWHQTAISNIAIAVTGLVCFKDSIRRGTENWSQILFLRFLQSCLQILNTHTLSIKRIVICPDTFVVLLLEIQSFSSGFQRVLGKSIHKCSDITGHYLQRLNRLEVGNLWWTGQICTTIMFQISTNKK